MCDSNFIFRSIKKNIDKEKPVNYYEVHKPMNLMNPNLEPTLHFKIVTK